MEIIDTHCHIYPRVSELLIEHQSSFPSQMDFIIKKIELIERKTNFSRQLVFQLLTPLLKTIQKQLPQLNQDYFRPIHKFSDKIYSVSSLATLFNCHTDDLIENMLSNNITQSIVIAHPPLVSNNYLLDQLKDINNLHPVINIPIPVKNMEDLLTDYIERGAKGIKIHAAASGVNPKSKHHRNLLNLAQKYQLPVIIHTGSLEVKPFYQNPEYGHAEYFEKLIEGYTIPIILAHMNIHFPEVAMHICKKLDHVFTDISWQNSKSILKAIKKCGADKILYGTDWPIVGTNTETTLARLLKLKEDALITNNDLQNIFSQNAIKLFKL